MRTLLSIVAAALVGGAAGFALGFFKRPAPADARVPVFRQGALNVAAPAAPKTIQAGGPSFATSADAEQLRRDLEAFHREGVLASTDIPYFQQQMEERAERMAASYLDRNRARYLELFSALGVNEADSERLLQFAAQVYKAKAKGNNVLTDILSVQQAYERVAAGILGPEAHQEYARLEAGDQARRELDFLTQHAAQGGTALSASEKAALLVIIQDGGAYSASVSAEFGSPFSPIIVPFGPREAIGNYSSKLAAIEEQRNKVLAAARTQGLTEGTIAAVDDYYTKAASDFQKMRDSTTARGRATTLLETAARLRATSGPSAVIDDMEERARQLLEQNP